MCPHVTHASLGPPESITQMASRPVQPFLHSSRQGVVRHVGARPSPQNCPFPRGIWIPTNTWFLASIRFSIPNGTSDSSAVFA